MANNQNQNNSFVDFEELYTKLIEALKLRDLRLADDYALQIARLYDKTDKVSVFSDCFSDVVPHKFDIIVYRNLRQAGNGSWSDPLTFASDNELPDGFVVKEFEGIEKPFKPDGRNPDGSVDLDYYSDETFVTSLTKEVRKWLIGKMNYRNAFHGLARMRVLIPSFRLAVGNDRFVNNPYIQRMAYYWSQNPDSYVEKERIFFFTRKVDGEVMPFDTAAPFRMGLLLHYAIYWDMYGEDFIFSEQTFDFLFQNPYVHGVILKKILTNVKFLFCCMNNGEGISINYFANGNYEVESAVDDSDYFDSLETEFHEAVELAEEHGLTDLANKLEVMITEPVTLENIVKYSFLFNALPLYGYSSGLVPFVKKLVESKEVVVDTESDVFRKYQSRLIDKFTIIFNDMFGDYGIKDKNRARKEIIANTKNASFGESVVVYYSEKDGFSSEPGKGRVRLNSTKQPFVNLFDAKLALSSLDYDVVTAKGVYSDGIRFVDAAKEARSVNVGFHPYKGILIGDGYYAARRHFPVLRTTGNDIRDGQLLLRFCNMDRIAIGSDFSNFDGTQNDTNVFNGLMKAFEITSEAFKLDTIMYDSKHTVYEAIGGYLRNSFNATLIYDRQPLSLTHGDGLEPSDNIREDWSKYDDYIQDFNFLFSGHKWTLLINSVATQSISETVADYLNNEFGLELEDISCIGDDSIMMFHMKKDIPGKQYIEVKQRIVELCSAVGFKVNISKTSMGKRTIEYTKKVGTQGVQAKHPGGSAVTGEGPTNAYDREDAFINKMYHTRFTNTFSPRLMMMILPACIFSFHRIFTTQRNKRDFFQKPLSTLFVPTSYGGGGVFPPFELDGVFGIHSMIPSQFYSIKKWNPESYEYLMEIAYKFRGINRYRKTNEIIDSDFYQTFQNELVRPMFGQRIDRARDYERKLRISQQLVPGFTIDKSGNEVARSIAKNLPKNVFISDIYKQYRDAKHVSFEDIPLSFIKDAKQHILDLFEYDVSVKENFIHEVSCIAFKEKLLNDTVRSIGVSLGKATFAGPRSNIANSILRKFDREFPVSFEDDQIIDLLRKARLYRREKQFVADNLISAGYDAGVAISVAGKLFEAFGRNYDLDIISLSLYNDFTQTLNISSNVIDRFWNHEIVASPRILHICRAFTITYILTFGPNHFLTFNFDKHSQFYISEELRKSKFTL